MFAARRKFDEEVASRLAMAIRDVLTTDDTDAAADMIVAADAPAETIASFESVLNTTLVEDQILALVVVLAGIPKRSHPHLANALHVALMNAVCASGSSSSPSNAIAAPLAANAAAVLGQLYALRYYESNPHTDVHTATLGLASISDASRDAIDLLLARATAGSRGPQTKPYQSTTVPPAKSLGVAAEGPSVPSFSLSSFGMSQSIDATPMPHSAAPLPPMCVGVGDGSAVGSLDAASEALQPSVQETGGSTRRERTPARNLTPAQNEELRSRTVYLNRLDPAITEGEFRDVLIRCGPFNKVRLCGEVPGRTRYGFVEFSAIEGARRLLLLDRTLLGGYSMRCLSAKCPILDFDANVDAIIDPKRGCVRACLFGLSM